jgi:probable rRNA maturation factor
VKKETLKIVQRVLKGEQCKNTEISVIGIDDASMIQLNKKYLRHNYPTDVLSFNLSDDLNGTLEGEVYINLDQAYRQGKYLGISFKREVQRLVVHGILHLVGYRDDTLRQKKRMTQREDYYLGLER